MRLFVYYQGDFQTKKEAAWAISNLTISGRKEQVSGPYSNLKQIEMNFYTNFARIPSELLAHQVDSYLRCRDSGKLDFKILMTNIPLSDIYQLADGHLFSLFFLKEGYIHYVAIFM